MNGSRWLPWRNRPLAVRTLDENAPLIVDFVGDEDGSTAQIGLTQNGHQPLSEATSGRGREGEIT